MAGWVGGSIETKAISASNLELKLKLTEAELGNKCHFEKFQKTSGLDLLAVTEFSEAGDKMVTTITIKQDPTIKSVRGFVRIE